MTLYRIDLYRMAAHPAASQMAIDVRALEKAHIIVPVVLEPSLKWCFRHNMQAYDGICSFRGTYGPCDVGDAAVVRIDKE